MSQKYYEPEFKKKIIKLRLEEGRTIPSICSEYSIARSLEGASIITEAFSGMISNLTTSCFGEETESAPQTGSGISKQDFLRSLLIQL